MIKAFHSHKRTARIRGIEFLFTLQEWRDVWVSSGRLGDRGNRAHQFCMARFEDIGPYAIGNVKIITNSENRAEQKLTEITRERMRNAKLGRPQTAEHVANRMASAVGRKDSEEARRHKREAKLGEKNPMFGKHPSRETREKLSAARRGRVFSQETREKIRQSRLKYWAQRKLTA